MVGYFFEGFVLGLAYVAPIGVQNLFVIDAAINRTRLGALQTAVIVIFFDITLALACFWGVGSLMERFQLLKMIILLAGCIAVTWIGIQLILKKPDSLNAVDVNKSITKVIITACLVTLFNPQAIIDGSLLLGAFRASMPPDVSTTFIVGVCTASALWFLGISAIVSTFRHSFNGKIIKRINVVCGLIIIFYGVKLGWSFIKIIM